MIVKCSPESMKFFKEIGHPVSKFHPTSVPIVLASASPRRRQLLADSGYHFIIEPSEIDEPEPTGPCDVRKYVSELAFRKAWEVANRRRAGLILAADTACQVDGRILNKPADRAGAEEMIRLQEGRPVEILTGLVLFHAERWTWIGAVETTVVQVRTLSSQEREAYLNSGDWEGKAGGYGLQDKDPFVSILQGSFSNAVGLPMERLQTLLAEHPELWNQTIYQNSR